MYAIFTTILELFVILLTVVLVAIIAGIIVCGVLFLIALVIQCVIDGIDSLMQNFYR